MAKLSKRELFQQIESAIHLSGLWFLSLPNQESYYRRYQIIGDSQSFRTIVYIWNVTHGGGTRAENEYRIQVTGRDISQFHIEPGQKTLILGWWDEMSVFVAFDYSYHSEPFGHSPSFQVSSMALEDACRNGFATHTKATGETVIAFRPDYFAHYVEQSEPLHKCGEFSEVSAILQQAGTNLDEIPDEAIPDAPEECRYAVMTTRRVLREQGFRDRVLTAYGHRCAMCTIQLKLLDAAHIVPAAHPKSTDETNNGVALCTLHHRAFDRGLVTFDQRYRTHIDENKVSDFHRQSHDGGLTRFRNDLRPVISLPIDNRDHPRPCLVEEANKLRGWIL